MPYLKKKSFTILNIDCFINKNKKKKIIFKNKIIKIQKKKDKNN